MTHSTEGLRFLNQPKVCTGPSMASGEKFYVAGIALDGSNPAWFYLHQTGWDRTACTEDEKDSGYFDSFNEAMDALQKLVPSLQKHALFDANLHDLRMAQTFVDIWG